MSSANRSLALRILARHDPAAALSRRQAPGTRKIRALAAGFTLVELILACSILLVLATVAIPLARVEIKRRKEADLRYDLREMRTAIDRF
ncbi:MAG TPA: prepilin-type N-terminal cleavage/methylation domain-containing protein, partial [Candidatus Acidoferrum sp.]|nr:prepilin-type N-terminal cleavage/methylation domain-containing protein [Candidatus Acidoferrum sp.]